MEASAAESDGTDAVQAAPREQLIPDRETGYTYSAGGWIARGAAVASPVVDVSGECFGALVISAPIGRLTSDVAAIIGPVIREAAATLSRRAGFTSPPQ